MRVGPDERVGKGLPVTRLDHARKELEIDLVDDAGVRWNDLQVVECRLAPAQERVALTIPLELQLGVAEDRPGGGVLVHLHGVVDDELGRQLRVDLRRITAELRHRIAHRREIDNGRDPGEVLMQHAGRSI